MQHTSLERVERDKKLFTYHYNQQNLNRDSYVKMTYLFVKMTQLEASAR